MIKNQDLFPISEIDADQGFELMARFDERNLMALKDDYLHLPSNHIVPALLRMEARIDIMDDPAKRRPYRAGVILGSYLTRHRLHSMDVEPVNVFGQEVIGAVNWQAMRTSRFVLRQYFTEGIDVKHHLYRTIEQPWAEQSNSFASPEARYHELLVDWMSIGLGDTLRLSELAYDEYRGVKSRVPVTASLTDSTSAAV